MPGISQALDLRLFSGLDLLETDAMTPLDDVLLGMQRLIFWRSAARLRQSLGWRCRSFRDSLVPMVPRAGVEPATCRLGGDRSIH